MNSTYKSIVVREADGQFPITIEERSFDELPAGDVLIKVAYSSLNFKDALSATGVKFITANYPHTTGIDAAGTVVSSVDPRFAEGASVIVTGFDLGMETDGGHAEYIRVPADWVVPLPTGLTLMEAMIIGTAGFTAGLSVMEVIKRGIKPQDGPVIVSGATGGVGSVAVKILSKLGYDVHAVSVSRDLEDYLFGLGARKVLLADDFQKPEEKGAQLLDPEYMAVVDSVGGQVLSTLIKKLKYGGVATTCGLVNGTDLDLTIFAFINRGVQVSGIDSVWVPMERRLPVWEHLGSDWRIELTQEMYSVFPLEELPEHFGKILKGQMKGRGIVKIA